MTELLTAAQMRAIEADAIARGPLTGLDLMERAGAGVVDEILAVFPALDAAPGCAVVLCGPGNNGGDGFVIARRLAERGWTVWAFLHGDAARLPPDARTMHDRWAALGPVWPAPELDAIAPRLDRLLPRTGAPRAKVLVVDALFGIGLSRPLAPFDIFGGNEDLWRLDGGLHVVAVDVPSGLCAESGQVLVSGGAGSVPLPADLTVTFHGAKPGHFLASGPAMCGRLRIVDLGLPKGGTGLHLAGFGALAPRGLGKGQGHKFDHGHALVLSGPPGAGGAARLAARAALRIGAGLVTLGCASAAVPEHAARLDAIMIARLDTPGALAYRLADPRIGAVVAGPGLGLGPDAAALVKTLLDAANRPEPGERKTENAPSSRALVLDADALTHIARDTDLFHRLPARCVLTPHGGEFARLFPDLAARLASGGPRYTKLDATREAAARAGCVVLYKGADTVIAAPDGRIALSAAAYDRAAPWLATAGSGDVLAGLIGGLLARRIDPFRAAGLGAWLHVEAACRFGPGLIAEDLPDLIPAVLRSAALV